MKNYIVAADFKKETIDRYALLNYMYNNCKVSETYGQVTTENVISGGRDILELPSINLTELKKYITYSEKHDIAFNYTINGLCIGNKEFTKEGLKRIYGFLNKIFDVGVRKVTVALPSLIDIIANYHLHFEIKASVICNISTPNEASDYMSLGAERIVASEWLNRDIPKLKILSNYMQGKMEIIVNSMCLKNCIYRTAHYNQTAHDSLNVQNENYRNYYKHKCLYKRFSDVKNILNLCWIRPEDIGKYHAIGINNFKIQGRLNAQYGDPSRTVEAYFKEKYEGNLIDLLELFYVPYSFKFDLSNNSLDGFIEPFFRESSFCQNNCNVCNYCSKVANQIEKNYLSICKAAMRFYGEETYNSMSEVD